MLPDEPSDEERLEEVDNDDGATPFRQADDVRSEDVNDTHPDTDSDIQPEEVYHDGLSVDEPNKGNAVVDYDPDKDRRQDHDRQ